MAEKVKPEKTENKYEQIYRRTNRKVQAKVIGYYNGHIFTY